MKIKGCILSLIVLAGSLITAHSLAESLWRDRNLFSDRKARGIGDIVTIVISETAAATHTNSTERGKEAKAEGGPKGGLTKNLLDFIPFFGAEGKTEYKGEGKTTRSGTLRAKMTAQIVNLLPNGNLAIEGKRSIKVNGEEEEIVVTGIVRPDDIKADNTIQSSFIADAQIRYKGGLSFSDRERPGLIARILNGIANFFF